MTHLYLNQELREIYKPYLESLKKQTWDSFVSAPLLNPTINVIEDVHFRLFRIFSIEYIVIVG